MPTRPVILPGKTSRKSRRTHPRTVDESRVAGKAVSGTRGFPAAPIDRHEFQRLMGAGALIRENQPERNELPVVLFAESLEWSNRDTRTQFVVFRANHAQPGCERHEKTCHGIPFRPLDPAALRRTRRPRAPPGVGRSSLVSRCGTGSHRPDFRRVFPGARQPLRQLGR